jgi:hypothetical protein
MSTTTRMQTLRRWGLRDNPFVTLPPSEEDERMRVFTARGEEVETLCNLVERARGVFLCGLFGMGKSILVLETLRRVRQKDCATSYAKYYPVDGVQSSVLRRLAVDVAEQCADAAAIYEILSTGTALPRPSSTITLEHVKDAIPHVKNSAIAVESIIRQQRDCGRPVIIALDDVHKGAVIASIADIVEDIRDLIDWGSAVILLGHPFGVTAGLSSSTDILYPLPLGPLAEDELLEMMGKYVALACSEPDEQPHPTHPFSTGAAEIISRGIAEFELTPRVFNFACQLILERAAEAGIEVIDEEFVVDRWPEIAEDYIMRTLRDEDKRYLEVVYKGGPISEDNREAIEEIGGRLAGYVEVRNILARLVQENILIEQHEHGKRVLGLNPPLDRGESIFTIVR